MTSQKKIAKPLATVLNNTYARALEAREAVEHRLASLLRQEQVVRLCKVEPKANVLINLFNHETLHHIEQGRIQREINKLERYQSELPERLSNYDMALQAIDQVTEDVFAASNRASIKGATVPWPDLPKILLDDLWPSNWPPRPRLVQSDAVSGMAYVFDNNIYLPPPQLPSPKLFKLVIDGHVIELEALYEEGIGFFNSSLESYLSGLISSRWPAITEAVRSGIRWPQLDDYLAECEHPWLPKFFVDEFFGLRGTLERREELANIMAKISPDAGRWYLSMQPQRYSLKNFVKLDPRIIEELISLGLVRWGSDMPTEEMLREIPPSEVKLLFLLAGMPPPRGYEAAVSKYGELASVHGEEFIKQRIRRSIDPSEIIEVVEIEGWNSEERLGPRARANVLVSTLILLHDRNSEAQQVIRWNK